MIRALLHDPDTNRQVEGGEELIEAWQSTPDSILWVDFFGVDAGKERQIMQEQFGLHPLAIQDAQRERHPPKFEPFADHSFILVKGLDAATRDLNFGTIQIGIFLAERVLATRHAEVSKSTDAVWDQAVEDPELLAQGADRLGIRVASKIFDRYLPILLALEVRLEELEDEMIHRPSDRLLAELVGHKAELKKLRRIITYHEQLADTLRGASPPGIRSELQHELTDMYEHLERMTSLAGLYYELASDLMDGYITMASHRLNHIVKVLTIVTTIFVPLSFMAGLYGMNFENMPELQFRYGYVGLLGLMALTAGSLIFMLYRKGWIRGN